MGEFAASIAHDIIQPLAAVVAHGQAAQRWLNRDVPNLVEAQESITGAVNAADRARDVITRIRAVLRNDKPEYLAVDINSVIRDILTLTNSTLQGRNVSVRTRLPADLPQVRGDRIGLQQVIMNLITNGTDAMSSITDRSRILRIESQIEASGSVLVAVADAGTGFNPGIADRIFDPLFTTKPNGMGLGLSICRSIIEAHGGQLWASWRGVSIHDADLGTISDAYREYGKRSAPDANSFGLIITCVPGFLNCSRLFPSTF